MIFKSLQLDPKARKSIIKKQVFINQLNKVNRQKISVPPNELIELKAFQFKEINIIIYTILTCE
jgi:hypothetical protein